MGPGAVEEPDVEPTVEQEPPDGGKEDVEEETRSRTKNQTYWWP